MAHPDRSQVDQQVKEGLALVPHWPEEEEACEQAIRTWLNGKEHPFWTLSKFKQAYVDQTKSWQFNRTLHEKMQQIFEELKKPVGDKLVEIRNGQAVSETDLKTLSHPQLELLSRLLLVSGHLGQAREVQQQMTHPLCDPGHWLAVASKHETLEPYADILAQMEHQDWSKFGCSLAYSAAEHNRVETLQWLFEQAEEAFSEVLRPEGRFSQTSSHSSFAHPEVCEKALRRGQEKLFQWLMAHAFGQEKKTLTWLAEIAQSDLIDRCSWVDLDWGLSVLDAPLQNWVRAQHPDWVTHLPRMQAQIESERRLEETHAHLNPKSKKNRMRS